MQGRSLRVVVCGTTFGQFYLAALPALRPAFELVGILSRGSAQSAACAERAGVPLFTDPAQLRGRVDVACVVVRSGVTGGAGSDLARELLALGIHVLQEQPVHHDDVAGCVQAARRHGVVYLLGDLYVHLPPVRRFVAAARGLLARRPARQVDARCAIQVAFPLVHILGEALGTIRPWGLTAAPEPSGPSRVLTGHLGDTPLTAIVHHEIDPDDPDNHLPLLQQISISTDAGRLCLTDTHGPLTWAPRLHIPDPVKTAFDFDDEAASFLAEPSLVQLDPSPPSYREILTRWWPAAIGADLLTLRDQIFAGRGSPASEQYHLTLCRLWQEATTELGYPALRPAQTHRPLPATELIAAAAAAATDPR
ncbi:Gfo/Idh/MocA family oxidoreductase [Actinopolymorpha pittospori]|uniref:Thiazolinyl imide reductase n=1 Tax=Actinopolymorpha pittospori TaxID=648752 RepID=A0A927MRH7_9ACTN|nr:Gfo/Idh/MocA family oxidoreductase [Actinopolymorpha pittospori]MBE1603893.1 thiazolinyl imide reductase [Actinopolymorpha pittospori]